MHVILSLFILSYLKVIKLNQIFRLKFGGKNSILVAKQGMYLVDD
jgi:hypothetical protein